MYNEHLHATVKKTANWPFPDANVMLIHLFKSLTAASVKPEAALNIEVHVFLWVQLQPPPKNMLTGDSKLCQNCVPSTVERRLVSSRCSSDALATFGRHRSVLARKIPASAAPTAPRPSDHIPMSNSSPSRPDPGDDTAAHKGAHNEEGNESEEPK